MSIQAMFIVSLIKLPAREKSLLRVISECCDINNEFIYNKQYIAEASGLPLDAIKKIMTKFEESGLISSRVGVDNAGYILTAANYLRSQNLEIVVDEQGFIITQAPQVNLSLSAINELTLKQKYTIFNRDKFKCLSCYSVENLQLNHIIPLSNGGSNSKENLQTLCHSCDFKKGEQVIDYRASIIPEQPVFNPANIQPETGPVQAPLILIDNLLFSYEYNRLADLVGFNGDVQAQWHAFIGHYIANKSPIPNENIKTQQEWQGLWRKWIAGSKGFQKDFLISKKRFESTKGNRIKRREKRSEEINATGFDNDIWDIK